MSASAWGYAAALGSAILVGFFTVLNKWLLSAEVPPLTAAMWTYFAAGIVLLPWAIQARGLSLKRRWITAGWLLAGSLIGPACYFSGLKLTSGVQGVLMINLEAVFTAFLAFVFLKERMTIKTLTFGLVVLVGGVWLSWPDTNGKWLSGSMLGNLLIAAGYLGWATENNLGRLLGADNPVVTLVSAKALVAAVFMALLALTFDQGVAVSWNVVPVILASGAVALGLSLALFYFAMQQIGAGRAGLISSTSALWGGVAALILLQEPLDSKVIIGGFLMVLGLAGFAWETSRVEDHRKQGSLKPED